MSTDHKPFNGHTPEETARNEAKVKFYTQQWDKEEDRQLFSEWNAVAEREQAAYVEGAMSREAELSSLRASLKMCVEELDAIAEYIAKAKDPIQLTANMVASNPKLRELIRDVKATHPNL